MQPQGGVAMTLKKSEKILLQLLVIFAAIALGAVFLLLPALDEKQVLTEEHNDLRQEYQSRQELLENQSLDEKYKEAKETAKENYNYFYAVLNSYTIDGIINKTAQDRNLSIQSLSIGKYEEAAEDFEEKTGNKLEVLVKSVVSISVKGTYGNILGFVDDLNEKSPCLRISLVSVTENNADATGNEPMVASLKIYIYGIDVKLDELE
jgi:Tfp pilus assembly protein PilO